MRRFLNAEFADVAEHCYSRFEIFYRIKYTKESVAFVYRRCYALALYCLFGLYHWLRSCATADRTL